MPEASKTTHASPASAPATTREQILDAAESLFASQGYAATTIKQVAEVVGIQGPGIYKHFSNKRALFEEVLERLFTPFLELLTEEAKSGTGQEAIVRQHLANPNASRIVQHATLSGGEDLALLVERWYLPFFRDVRDAAARADPGFSPVAVMAFHSMLLGYLTLAPLHEAIFDRNPLSADALAELLALQRRLAASAAQ
jgi:AcrR family transcriptional regulator